MEKINRLTSHRLLLIIIITLLFIIVGYLFPKIKASVEHNNVDIEILTPIKVKQTMYCTGNVHDLSYRLESNKRLLVNYYISLNYADNNESIVSIRDSKIISSGEHGYKDKLQLPVSIQSGRLLQYKGYYFINQNGISKYFYFESKKFESIKCLDQSMMNRR